jgi:hypothetical protein
MNINDKIADLLTERPSFFKVGSEVMCFYPSTLGKKFLISDIMKQLEIDAELIRKNPYFEALRIVSKKRDMLCRLLSYHTFDKREELYDIGLIEKRAEKFSALSNEELATLFISVNIDHGIGEFIKHFGLDKEKEKMRRISEIKKMDSSSLSFGAKSVFGALVVPACEKLHMTPREVIWGISYNLLQMLMADAEVSVFLTDDERKKAHISKGSFIKADDPNAMARLDALGL